ncbi:proline-rich receptor-like protein kinase PERK7 [Iris pallida]|uniref:Proline-rich receptor-like protein kinase PERK7 n=1 Tax=Iris pallida TaxID=29817 RepID=A0AAX6E7I8_IRIPA|nr:proline-rich receptor-like protein kinase PERK7 [Iris pallida]
MSGEEEKRNLISAGEGDDDAAPSDEDSDFEFTVCSGSGSPPESTDPYPVFDRNLLLDPPPPKSDLRSASGSSSSTAAEEEEKHRAWAPGSSPDRCKKSSSTGSAPSRRFKLKDLVSRRSHSDGKKKLGFVGGAAADQKGSLPKPSPNPNPNLKKKKKEEDLKPGEMDLLTAHRLFYGGKDGEKGVKGGKAYLPHRSGPVGLFPNGNGLTRAKFPF